MIIPYENLDLIPLLLQEIRELKNDVNSYKLKNKIVLNKVSEVAKFLGVSKLTIYNMIKDNRLKENIHYEKQIVNNMIKYTFVAGAIVSLKGG